MNTLTIASNKMDADIKLSYSSREVIGWACRDFIGIFAGLMQSRMKPFEELTKEEKIKWSELIFRCKAMNEFSRLIKANGVGVSGRFDIGENEEKDFVNTKDFKEWYEDIRTRKH